jgi:hypothetical protein
MGFEGFTAATMKNAVFWDVALRELVLTDVSEEQFVNSLLVNAYRFSRSRISSTWKMEATCSSEASVLTRSLGAT